MQGLAECLGVSPATLYSHVEGRGEVIELVESRLQTTMRRFSTDAVDWRSWLTEFATLVRSELGSSASTLLNATRDDASMRIDIGEPGLRLLIDAGLNPVDAAYAVWLVLRVAVTASSGTDPSFARYLDPTADLIDSSSNPKELTALQRVYNDLTANDSHDTCAFDLDIVLDGIAAKLERQSNQPDRPTERPV